MAGPDEREIERVAAQLAPVRHRFVDYGYRRPRVLAIDLELAKVAIATVRKEPPK